MVNRHHILIALLKIEAIMLVMAFLLCLVFNQPSLMNFGVFLAIIGVLAFSFSMFFRTPSTQGFDFYADDGAAVTGFEIGLVNTSCMMKIPDAKTADKNMAQIHQQSAGNSLTLESAVCILGVVNFGVGVILLCLGGIIQY